MSSQNMLHLKIKFWSRLSTFLILFRILGNLSCASENESKMMVTDFSFVCCHFVWKHPTKHEFYLIFSNSTAEFCVNASDSLCWCDQNSFVWKYSCFKLSYSGMQWWTSTWELTTDNMRIRDTVKWYCLSNAPFHYSVFFPCKIRLSLYFSP